MAIPIKAILSVSTKSFNVGLKLATKAVGGLVAITKVAAVAVLGLSAAFVALVARQAAIIDRIGKVSKVTGVAAETLQKFQFAAELAGVSSDQAAVALRRFSRRLGEAQKGTGELAPTLRRLGIDLRDGSGEFKSAEQVLLELADGIKNTEGESAKLAIAFKAFDSEGAELVNTLSDGADALEDVFNRAELLGAVLSTDAIQGVEDFNDSFKELTTLLNGIVAQLTAALAPALELLVEKLTAFTLALSKEFGGVENLGEALAVALIDSIQTIIKAFGQLQESVIGFVNDFRFYARNLGFRQLSADAQAFQDILDITNNLLGDIGGGKPFDRFSKKLAAVMEGMTALKRVSDQVGDLLPGLDTKQLNEYEDNLTEILTTFNALVESGETNAFRQKKSLESITPLLERNLELLREGLEQQIYSNDQIEMNYETYEAIMNVLSQMRGTILYNTDNNKKDNEVLEDKRTILEKIRDTLKQMGENFKDFVGSTVDFGQIMENVAARLGTPIERLSKTLEDGLVKSVELFEDTLTDAILTGKADFSTLGDHIKQVLAKALVQRFISGPILALFGLAKGGPAKAGQPYIVGEEGPELFVPNQSGMVIPNNKLTSTNDGYGLGGGTTINYNISAIDTVSFQQRIAQDPEFIFAVTQAGARRMPGG